jgi:predicted transcriptional regulator
MLVDRAEVPVYLRVAEKAKHLRELGMSDKAIARALGVSDKTVSKAISCMYRSESLTTSCPNSSERFRSNQ